MATYTQQQFGSNTVTVDADGYIYVSKICKEHGKKVNDWLARAATKKILKSSSEKLEICPKSLFKIVRGSHNDHRGTYLHPLLFVSFITWCSSDIDASVCHLVSNDRKNHITITKKDKEIEIIDENSGIYLVEMGQVKELRQHIHIDDKHPAENMVYKFGVSCDIPRRFRQHQRKYTFARDIKLIYTQHIDCRYRYNAEACLKTSFDDMNIRLVTENHLELVIFPPSMLRTIKIIYDGIHHQFHQ